MLRLSTGLRSYLLNHGSLAEALSGGVIYVFGGAQPASADDGDGDATLIGTITDGGAAYTREQPVTATLSLDSGGSGSVDSVTVGGTELLEAAVPFNSTLAQTATDLAAAINCNRFGVHGIYATDDGAGEVTLHSKRTWAPRLSEAAVTIGTTTISASKTNFTAIAAAPANGLHFAKRDADPYAEVLQGMLVKAPDQTWTGTAAASDTATWFRFTNHFLTDSANDDGSATSSEVLRMDGSIGLSDAPMVLDEVDIEASDPLTLSDFAVTATAMQTPESKLRMTYTLINYVLNFGSLAEALTGGDILLCGDEQPATADAAASTQLVQITDAGGSYQNEEMEITGGIALSGTSGSVDDVTINGTSLLSAPVPYNDSIGQTLADLKAALEVESFRNHGLKFQVYASTLYLNTLKTWSGLWAGGTVGVDVTTLGGTPTNFGTNTEVPANGLRFDCINAPRLEKLPTQQWSGTAVQEGDITSFRVRNHHLESNALDSNGSSGEVLRMDGDVATEGALVNLESVAVTSESAPEIAEFSIDATQAP